MCGLLRQALYTHLHENISSYVHAIPTPAPVVS